MNTTTFRYAASVIVLISLMLFRGAHAQDSLELSITIDPKHLDQFKFNHTTDGDCQIIAIRNKSKSGSSGLYTVQYPAGFQFDSFGTLVSQGNSKKLRVFLKKRNVLYPGPGNAFHQVYNNYLYNPFSETMDVWYVESGKLSLNQVSIDGAAAKHQTNDPRIPGGSLLVSWDTYNLNDTTYRHLLVYNATDQLKMTFILIDYNTATHTAKITESIWYDKIREFNGWDRPSISIKRIDEGEMYCIAKIGKKKFFLILDSDLDVVDGELYSSAEDMDESIRPLFLPELTLSPCLSAVRNQYCYIHKNTLISVYVNDKTGKIYLNRIPMTD